MDHEDAYAVWDSSVPGEANMGAPCQGRLFLAEGRPMSFEAAPEKFEGEENELLVQPGDEDGQGGIAAMHVDTRLQTNLTSARIFLTLAGKSRCTADAKGPENLTPT